MLYSSAICQVMCKYIRASNRLTVKTFEDIQMCEV
uniref:Uncharacterized protein n=1 Tax=Arundo donax TaxID=35708 RepID=A0A0A9DHW5_ARUDO